MLTSFVSSKTDLVLSPLNIVQLQGADLATTHTVGVEQLKDRNVCVGQHTSYGRYGAGSFAHPLPRSPAESEVLPEGATHGDRVDTRMGPESPVLEGECRGDDPGRELFERPVPEIRRLSSRRFAEVSALAIEKKKTRFRAFELRAG